MQYKYSSNLHTMLLFSVPSVDNKTHNVTSTGAEIEKKMCDACIMHSLNLTVILNPFIKHFKF